MTVALLEAEPGRSRVAGNRRRHGVATRGLLGWSIDADEALERCEPGDVVITRFTVPTFNSVLALAGAVVTEQGGLLCHTAVIARELGIAAVVGCVGCARDRRRRNGRGRPGRRHRHRGRLSGSRSRSALHAAAAGEGDERDTASLPAASAAGPNAPAPRIMSAIGSRLACAAAAVASSMPESMPAASAMSHAWASGSTQIVPMKLSTGISPNGVWATVWSEPG